MANIGDPIAIAAKLEDIGFAEFTTNLVLKVFDGLVAANLNQTEAYIQLVQSLAKTLKEYVDDTHETIGGTQVLEFLASVLQKSNTDPGKALGDGKPLTTLTLTADDATAVNGALTLPTTSGGETNDNKVATQGAITGDALNLLFTAVARRLAANKYDLLKEMVKLGVLRLVVTNGRIETKLTFSASVSKVYESAASSYNSRRFDFAAKASTGKALAKWFSASASANYTSLSVRTTNERQQDVSGSQVNIFGSVLIEFKTDYLPLAG